jgi:hypothetical protein
MFDHPGRPPCDHRGVIEGDDVGSTTAKDPPTNKIAYGKAPESRAGKAVARGLLTIGIIAVLVVVVVAVSIWSSLGGVRHDPTDSTVRAARINADKKAGADIEVIAAELQPALGTPKLRALLDTCADTHDPESLNNDITCTRSFYLYYREPASEGENVSRAVATAMSPESRPNLCPPMTATTGGCSSTLGGSSVDVYHLTDSTAADVFFSYRGTAVETDGFSELASAAKSNCIVVRLSVVYFEG